jgi:hypothetical protein
MVALELPSIPGPAARHQLNRLSYLTGPTSHHGNAPLRSPPPPRFEPPHSCRRHTYFIRKNGIITLRPEFGPAFRHAISVQVDPLPTNPVNSRPRTHCENGMENGASTDGVNTPCTSLVENVLDGKPC